MKKILMLVIAVVLFFWGRHYAGMAYEEYAIMTETKKQNEYLRNEVILKNEKNPMERKVDFALLEEINPDIVGWIWIPGTSIDYPILVGNEDDEYLNLDMEGKESKLGSIFSFCDTDRELSDARTVLFGHNMRDYQMFGELKRYQDLEFRKNHKRMYIYTRKRTMELCVFSIFVCEENADIFEDDTILGTNEYKELVQVLHKQNEYDDISIKNINIIHNVRTFSLVTCSGNAGTSNRLLVNSFVIGEKYCMER